MDIHGYICTFIFSILNIHNHYILFLFDIFKIHIQICYFMYLGKFFQIKDPVNCNELVSKYIEFEGGSEYTWSFSQFTWNFLSVKKDHINKGFRYEVVL